MGFSFDIISKLKFKKLDKGSVKAKNYKAGKNMIILTSNLQKVVLSFIHSLTRFESLIILFGDSRRDSVPFK